MWELVSPAQTYPAEWLLDIFNGAYGTCEDDCRQREDLQMPPKAYTPTDADMKFLADVRVSWHGDKRV